MIVKKEEPLIGDDEDQSIDGTTMLYFVQESLKWLDRAIDLMPYGVTVRVEGTDVHQVAFNLFKTTSSVLRDALSVNDKLTALSVKTTAEEVSPGVSPEVKEREDVFQQPLLSWVAFYKLLVSRNLATFGETNEVYRQRTEELYGVGVLKNLAPTPIISEADYHKLRITKEDALKQVLHGLPEIAGLLE